MFRIMAGGLCGSSTPGIAQAAAHAGYSALVGLESIDRIDQVRRLFDAMVLAKTEFTASTDRFNDELLQLLAEYASRGLKEVLVTGGPHSDLPSLVAGLQRSELRVLVQTSSLDAASEAEKAGADGVVIARSEGTFALVRDIAAQVSIPFLVRGGVGLHTGAACLAAGAAGVVLDWQLALCEESELAADLKDRISRADFAELTYVGHDALLAPSLAAEYRTVKGICDAFRIAAFRNVRAARQHNVLREASPLAEVHGLRYPVFERSGDSGIPGYVVVGSAEQLRGELAKGSRKLVLEKSGAGIDLVYWEQAVETLVSTLAGAKGVVSDYHIVFAGDICDSRSGAMVAALAAPLSEKGVSIGVLPDQPAAGGAVEICRAGEFLDQVADKLYESQLEALAETAPDLRPETDIAIVGMSCIFPKANDVITYWQNILNKVNAVTEVPKDRWDVELYFDKDRRAMDKIYSRWGGFIDPIVFDPARYGMPPNSVPSVDPLQLLMLDLTAQALADAGYASRSFDRENTSVIVGVGGGTGELGLGYGFRSLLPHFITQAGGTTDDARQMIQDCDHILPSWTEDSFAGLLLNVVAGRVANRLDLGGTNYSVDAACATALAALRLAVTELESRSSNVVVAAGADMMNTPFGYLCFSKTQALSPSGQCRTFDETADGIVISEGFAVTICKRLEDALRDGDRIYAVIKSVGASSDGKDKGLTAPRPIGQMRALDRAYKKAGIAPETVGLIEAHGTGTVVGDRTEVESMTRFFEGAGAPQQSCALGSVKSMVGHTKCTAGMAGMVKAAMALQHKVLPPTINVTKPNSKANFETSPFYLNTETRPWIRRADGTPRRAGVSAFGFGGTNFHTVLQEAPELEAWPEPNQAVRDWPGELFIWKADSTDRILQSLNQLSDALAQGSEPLLCELAAAVCWEHARGNGAKCLAIIATAVDDLKAKIEIASAALKKGEAAVRDPRGVYYSSEPLARDGKVAFLFPGQGSQRPDMLADLAVALPVVREVFENADDSLGAAKLGKALSSFIFPPPTFNAEQKKGYETAIKQTNVAQPAVGAADMAVYRLLSSLGIHPEMTAGHSYGEFAALCAAGAMSFDDLIRISEARGRCIIEAAKDELGTMAAVDADEAAVAPVVAGVDGVVIANLNSPQQTVISGTSAGIAEAVKRFAEKKINARQVAVSCAFHSPLVADAKYTLGDALKGVTLSTPAVPVFSNTTAAPHSSDPNAIRAQLCEHLEKPVRFVDELNAMYAAGARVFVEAGPGRILTGLTERTLAGRSVMTIALDQPGRHGLLNLVHALGMLATAGVSFHAQHLFEGRASRRVDVARLLEDAKPKPLSPTAWLIENGRTMPGNRKIKTVSGQVKKTWVAADATPAAAAAPPQALPAAAPAPAPAMAAPAVAAPSSPNPLPAPAPMPAPAPAPVAAAAAKPPAVRTAPKPPMVNPTPAASRGPAPAGQGRVMQAHNELMAKFLQTQRNLMLSYLQGGSRPAAAPAAPAQRPARIPAAAAKHLPAPPAQVAAPAPAPAMAAPAVQAAPVPPPPPKVEVAAPIVPAPVATAPVTVKVAPAPVAAPAPAPAPAKENLVTRLVALVSERTGYPAEMLGLDLDLEADLGVDSIKRVEILSALQTETGAAGSMEGAIEELSKLKTLRAIAEFIENKAAAISGSAVAPAAAATKPAAAPAGAAEEFAVSRMLVEVADAPLPAASPSTSIPGVVLITDDGAAARTLASQLASRSIAAKILDAAQLSDFEATSKLLDDIRREQGRIGAVIHLSPLVESRRLEQPAWQARLDADLKSLYNVVRAAEADLRKDDSPGKLLAATRLGGNFAVAGTADFWPGNAAVSGFLKSVAREWPEVSCRTVDFEFDATADAVAAALLAELTSAKGLTEVGYQRGTRKTLRSVVTPIARNRSPLELNRDSVVFITGGARGITASIATELAGNFQCRLILAGRSPLPAGPEPVATAGVSEARQLKAVLVKQAKDSGQAFTPAAIESAYKKLLQEREIRSNLAMMSAAGSAVEYHAVDVADAAAIGALLDDLYARYGRIDGVIHGAGIIEDKLLRDKTPASFERVIRPKVAGALALTARLRPENLKFLVFFSSVSARYGNRGQCDYAAANEVLDKYAWWLNARWPGRVLSINWGPWKTENGMVSDALAAQFAKAGVQLIDTPSGRKIFLNELLFGRKEEPQVVWGGPIFHSAEEASSGAAPAGAKAVATASYPLLAARSAELEPRSDGAIQIVRSFDPAVDLYLQDHKLDGKPVLPMAMALELFAEAARAANPGKELIQIRDLKVLKGVTCDPATPPALRLQASSPRDGVLAMTLESADGRGLHYSAGAQIAAAKPLAQSLPGLQLSEPVSSRLSVAEIYENWLFHGPMFAGITRIDSVGNDGISGWIKPSAPAELLTYKPEGKWLVDPVIIDSGLQMLIIWARHHLDATPLPSRLATCHVLGSPSSNTVRCEIRINYQPGNQNFIADMRFLNEDGSMFARLEGMDATFSKSLNRLAGVTAAAGGTK